MPGRLLTEGGLPLPGPGNSKDLDLSEPFNFTHKFSHPNTTLYQIARAEFWQWRTALSFITSPTQSIQSYVCLLSLCAEKLCFFTGLWLFRVSPQVAPTDCVPCLLWWSPCSVPHSVEVTLLSGPLASWPVTSLYIGLFWECSLLKMFPPSQLQWREDATVCIFLLYPKYLTKHST